MPASKEKKPARAQAQTQSRTREKRNDDDSSSSKTYGFDAADFDTSLLPDVDHEFLRPGDIAAFEKALQAPDPLNASQGGADDGAGAGAGGIRSPRSPMSSSSFSVTKRDSSAGLAGMDDDVAGALAAAGGEEQIPQHGTFITAQNDWAPVSSRFYSSKKGGGGSSHSHSHSHGAATKRRRRRRAKQAVEGLLGTRSRDETREGYLYQLAKWPLLIFVFGWLIGLGVAYTFTRLYIALYEQFFTWRGKREGLRRTLHQATNYGDWVRAARELDAFLGRQAWREQNDFAYYDSNTVKRVWDQMKKTRAKAEAAEKEASSSGGEGMKRRNKKQQGGGSRAVDELKALTEACVKNNFVGIESPRLYSQTYYGTKNLVQNFVDEG